MDHAEVLDVLKRLHGNQSGQHLPNDVVRLAEERVSELRARDGPSANALWRCALNAR